MAELKMQLNFSIFLIASGYYLGLISSTGYFNLTLKIHSEMCFQGKERKNYFILAISALQATVDFFSLF